MVCSLVMAISILSAGCIDISEKGSDVNQIESENGKVILVRESVSGFTSLGYHNFVILFDNAHLYEINITNYQLSEGIDNDLTEEQVKEILNVTPTPMNWPLIDLFNDTGSSSVYTTKISKKYDLSDDCYSELLEMIDIMKDADLEPHYSGAGLSCLGWVYFTYKEEMSNRTISCYHDTSGAPDIIKNIDNNLNEICNDV